MEVDYGDTLLRQRVQEGRREDVHPAGEDDQVWALLNHLVRQRGVVPRPCLCELLRVLLPLRLEPAGHHVEVLGGDAGLLGARHGKGGLAVHKEPHDLRVGDAAGGDGVEQRLEVAAAAAGHDDDAARRSHGDDGWPLWRGTLGRY